MNIKTESIKELLEISLNKNISDINIKDLDKITYLKISRLSINGILSVDSTDLNYFHNLRELSIENCMIDNIFIDNLKKVSNIEKISFIHCDFINNTDYFNNLSIHELVLNDINGIDDIILSNIEKLIIINCSFKFKINNVGILDISRTLSTVVDFDNSTPNELIINSSQYDSDNLSLKCKIVVKNNYDEIIKVINND